MIMMNRVEVSPPVTVLVPGCSSIAAPHPSEHLDSIYLEPSGVTFEEAQALATMMFDAGSVHRVDPAAVEVSRPAYSRGGLHHHHCQYPLQFGIEAIDATDPVIEVDDLQSAGTVTAVVAALRRRSLDRIADRIEDLAAPDHDERDQPEIDLDSLKRAAVVLLEHPQWGEPEITLRDDRYLHLAWALQDDGRVAISFLPKGHVRFSALSAPVTTPGFLNIGGRHLQQPAIDSLRWFTARIVSR